MEDEKKLIFVTARNPCSPHPCMLTFGFRNGESLTIPMDNSEERAPYKAYEVNSPSVWAQFVMALARNNLKKTENGDEWHKVLEDALNMVSNDLCEIQIITK